MLGNSIRIFGSYSFVGDGYRVGFLREFNSWIGLILACRVYYRISIGVELLGYILTGKCVAVEDRCKELYDEGSS